ncbi:hypothetical protein N0V83_000005 [Neocucurbitaria cava]|uniref:Uncharacterized protein n=1 Tax=Neocucurbitaria cava TaxID=798079 RepID=A0A9W9CRL0_9PLEO|nr:hypothetical protein N0V83_000005 [Neocucurbitaria cava]
MSGILLWPVLNDSPTILPPSDSIGLPPDVFKKIMALTPAEGIKCPPHTIHQLWEDAESKKLLKSLEFITYLGAALDQAIGDELCQHVRLSPLIGSTETGDQMSICPLDRKLWYTHSFVPENGSEMVAVEGTNGLHELILNLRKDASTKQFQSSCWNPAFKGLKRVETKELYTPITDRDGETRWIFTARKDEMTKLNWLAKFHAHDIESRILRHPDLQSVLVGGEGRPVPFIIVEAKQSALNGRSEEQLLDSVYESVVVDTNKTDTAEIRIPRETLILAKTEKPFKRNQKEVVLRREVEKDYAHEIEAAYRKFVERKSSTV